MTQAQLNRAVARATSESVHTIREMGFGLLEEHDEPDADHQHLYMDCPFCTTPLLLSDRGLAYLPAEAECLRCDVFFDYRFDEIYQAEPANVEAEQPPIANAA